MTGDTQGLASSLAPVLREQCGSKLGPIEWFRCAWQAGGAATGFSVWTEPDGTQVPVLVKIPVGPSELAWTVALGGEPEGSMPPGPEQVPGSGVTPRVFASGSTIGGYDLAWFVTERLEGPPLSQRLDEAGVRDILSACVDFHQLAASVRPVEEAPKRQDWDKAIDDARQRVRTHALPESGRWGDALRKVHKHIHLLVGRWESRSADTWCHGDLHPGNALPRAAARGSASPRRCVLIDLALVHPGHWIEDAVYLERQFWGHEEMLHGVKPVSCLAQIRRERGLPTNDSYGDLASVRRVLMASLVPLFVDREHNAKYMHTALEVLEKYLPQVH
jgi:hypothetical protein